MYPEAKFLGVDPSASQVEAGMKEIEKLGVSNVRLETGTAAEIPGPEDRFDYIICHGVFSWVDEETQQGILQSIGGHLSENGLAYVSYNTLPGWNLRRIIRDLLLMHLPEEGDVDFRIRKAREILRVFEAAAGYEFERPYSLVMNAELRRIASESDAYLFHEFLEPENNPIFLSRFVEGLKSCGLQYVADTKMSRNEMHRLHKDMASERTLRDVKENFTERTGLEQFLDFSFHTPFRESILCRSDRNVAPAAIVDVLSRCRIAAAFEPIEGPPDLRCDLEEEFVDHAGRRLMASRPAVKAALVSLGKAWPGGLEFEELWNSLEGTVRNDPAQAALTKDGFLRMLFDYARKDHLDVCLFEMEVSAEVGDRPVVSSFVRAQARQGCALTNLRYETVEVGDFERELLQYLDGRHTEEMLIEELVQSLTAHGARIEEGGEEISDPSRQRELVATLLNDGLDTLRKAGLLSQKISTE